MAKKWSTAMCRALSSNSTLQYLDLSDASLLDEDVTRIFDGLKENSTLRHIDVRRNLAKYDSAVSIGKVLETNSTLQHLDLSSNAMEGNIAMPIAKALQLNATLQYLDLSMNAIGSEVVQEIATVLKQSNCALLSLNIGWTTAYSTDYMAIFRALRNNSTLQHLGMAFNSYGEIKKCTTELADLCSKELAELLRSNSTLISLDLTHSRIATVGAQLIFDALQHSNSTLQRLDLSESELVSKDAHGIGKMLEQNQTLRHLSLYDNWIDNWGGEALCHALPKNGTLQTLDIGRNEISQSDIDETIAASTRRNRDLKHTTYISFALLSLHLPIYVLVDIVDDTLCECHCSVDFVHKAQENCLWMQKKPRAQFIQSILKAQNKLRSAKK